MEESTMKKQVTLVAALEIAFGVIGILFAAMLYVILTFAQSFVVNEDIANTILSFIRDFVPSVVLICALLTFIGGMGLLRYKSWSRNLAMVMAAIGCIVIPVGTLIGVYAMWVLMQDDAKRLFV